jgi:hypothetical protein
MVRAVVTTAPMEVTPAEVGVTFAGVSVHVEPSGAPVQVNATGVVKPLSPVTVAVKFAVPPATTLAVVGFTATLKPGFEVIPVPDSATVCGLLASLSATLNVAVAVAATVGVNVTLMVHAPPAARVAAHVVVCANDVDAVPPMVTAIPVSVEVPLLVRVTTCAVLVVLMT